MFAPRTQEYGAHAPVKEMTETMSFWRTGLWVLTAAGFLLSAVPVTEAAPPIGGHVTIRVEAAGQIVAWYECDYTVHPNADLECWAY